MAKSFGTEAELCAKFIAAIGDKWISYAETQGWDILLVRKEDGFQIGIQAKLRFNVQVINQALEHPGRWHIVSPGPDCRAILVPESEGVGLGNICSYVSLTVIHVRPDGDPSSRWNSVFSPSLPTHESSSDDWFELAPSRRLKLPAYLPDVVAGSPSPIQLTDWKIAAIKIALTLERRGFVTREDFKTHKIDPRRFVAMGWMKIENKRYIAQDMPNFKKQHPLVWVQIEADAPTWMPSPETAGAQAVLL